MMIVTLLVSTAWIWSAENLPERNSYVEFRREFQGDGRPVTLRVAAGGEFCAEVNGQVASFGVYRDFPDRPAYNEVTVPTKKGANALAVGVFHSGNGFGSHSDGTPGLWTEVVSADGRTLAATGETGWQCRPLANYTFGKLPVTFGTLDWTYEYDASRSAAQWREPVAAAPRARPVKRPVAAPHLGEPIVAKEIYREAGEVGFDLGTIACGWLEFGVKAPKGTRIRVKNREVLNEGRVKIFGDVQPGDYYVANGTAAVFRHRYRYYGCRYLGFEFPKDAKGVAVSSVKLIPAVYDGFETPAFDCDDEFFNRLHEASVKTLRLCWMGRHVSNVWREQAWYPYDLRFEALYDYTLWGMYGESAANLEQVGRGTLPNGYAPCVGPAVKDPEKRIWIPMYTFAWMTALTENCFYSGDDGLFRKFSGQIKGMLDAALAIQKDGLYLPPEGMMRWDYCDPALEDWVGTPNDPPNAFYNLYAREALVALAPLYRAHGEAAYAEKLERLAAEIGERAVQRYWDAEHGLFADRVDKDGRKIRFYSHIQYLFLAQGLVPASERKAFIDRLLKFDLPFGSFASLTFLCKGILAYGTDAQLEQFHAYVKRIYSPMIDGGYDTIWESPRGPKYAGRNGCVCQGWAAFPAWYEAHVLLGVRPTKPGYAAYERKPRLIGGIKRVSGRVMTPRGAVDVSAPADGEPKHIEERTSAAAKSASALPEIYLIGDSIRIGYCKDVARALSGRAEVKWPDGNCANSQNVLINLGWWRKFASKPAVIQFNCGHWDAAHWDGDDEPITSVGEYARNVRLIIRRLRRYYPTAKLVYATTTPMNPSGVKGGNRRTTEEIRRYNAAAVAVAKAEGIAVNDLFALVEKWPAGDYADYCHFSPAANERLGKAVAERLMAQLQSDGDGI